MCVYTCSHVYVCMCRCMHVIDNHSPPYLWRQGLPHEPRAPHQIVQLASLHQRSPVSTSCALGLQLSPYAHPAFTWMLGIWTRVFTLAWQILNLWGTALNLCFLVTFSWVKSYLETQNVTVIKQEADMIRRGPIVWLACLSFLQNLQILESEPCASPWSLLEI